MENNLILVKLTRAPKGMVETLDDLKSKRMAGVRTNYIPGVEEVAAIIKTIPKGETRSIQDLRSALANLHRTDTACPAKVIKYWKWMANLSDDLKILHPHYDIPWWRVLKDGKPSRHMPGGIAAQKSYLQMEGVLM